jgi:replication factor C large subunit
MSLLINKYKPKKIDDLVGVDREIKVIKDFILNFKKGKALLIFGPCGCGKTSSIEILAEDLDLELFELNASNFRDKASIENILGSAIKQKSLFSKGKIILLDEIDGLSSKDRGGLTALIKIIQTSELPIILTSNDVELEKLESLIKKVVLLEYKKLEDERIFLKLKDICEKEKIKFNSKDLEKLAIVSRGDLRAAIIDLQTLTSNNELIVEGIEDFDRLQSEDTNKVLNVIFKKNDISESRRHIDLLNTNLIDVSKRNLTNVVFNNENVLYYWLEENIPFQYDNNSLSNSFEILSRSDLFRGRIMRRQYWRYLAYIVDLFSSISLENNKSMFSSYKKTKRSPKNNKKLWFLVSRKKKDIAGKIALRSNISMKRALNDFYYYNLMLNNEDLQDYLDLTKEEIEWINKR